jgi:hypothetical protein
LRGWNHVRLASAVRHQRVDLAGIFPEGLAESRVHGPLEPGIVVSRLNVRVRSADLRQNRGLRRSIEDVEVVGAEEREAPALGQSIPQVLEAGGALRVTTPAEEVDHLAESADRPPREPLLDLVHQSTDDPLEALARRSAIDHDRRQCLVRIREREKALLLELLFFPAANRPAKWLQWARVAITTAG